MPLSVNRVAGNASAGSEGSAPALLHGNRSSAFGPGEPARSGMGHEVGVARRLLTLLITRLGAATCFRCLGRDLGVRRVSVEAVAIGVASTLSNVEIRPARCSVCGAAAPTVCYRV